MMLLLAQGSAQQITSAQLSVFEASIYGAGQGAALAFTCWSAYCWYFYRRGSRQHVLIGGRVRDHGVVVLK